MSDHVERTEGGSERPSTPEKTEQVDCSSVTPVDKEEVAESSLPGGHPALSESHRYRTVRFHARGGLGEVHVAEDSSLNREVALKRMREEHARKATSRKRFLVEAEITARLEHPGIVPIYSLIEEDGNLSYTMRFIEGETLHDAIERFYQQKTRAHGTEDRLTFRQLLGRIIDVCHTIAFAHSRGVVHRDLKPRNIMLGKYGETLVVDWGLAKPIGEAEEEEEVGESTSLRPQLGDSEVETIQGQAVGTPSYMSPEQAAGRWDVLDTRTDVYSIGAILYVLLTGRAPIKGPNVSEILDKVRIGDFTRPSRLNPDAPRALEACCLKAMELRPEDRYQTVAELGADLEHWLADEQVSAYREPLPARIFRWGRRHPALVTGVAVLLMTALLGLGIGLFAVNREREKTEERRQEAVLARKEADKNAEKAEAQTHLAVASLAHIVLDLQSRLKEIPATQRARVSWLRSALKKLKEVGRTVPTGARANRISVVAHLEIGDLFLNAGGSLTDEEKDWTREAEWHFEEAFKLARQLYQDRTDANEIQTTLDFSAAYDKLGDVKLSQGHLQAAERKYRQSLDLCLDLQKKHPKNLQVQRDLAISYDKLGELDLQQARLTAAKTGFQAALDIRRALFQSTTDSKKQRELAASYSKLGEVSLSLEKPVEARAYFEQAQRLLESRAQREKGNVQAQRDLSVGYNKLGDTYLESDPPKARQWYMKAFALSEKLSSQSRDNAELKRDLSIAHEKLGDLDHIVGDIASARQHYLASRKLSEELVAQSESNMLAKRDLSVCLEKLGHLSLEVQELEEARASFEKALKLRQVLAQKDRINVLAGLDLVVAHAQLGFVDLEERKYPEAKKRFVDALDRLHLLNAEDRLKEDPRFLGWKTTLTGQIQFCENVEKSLKDLSFALNRKSEESQGLLEARAQVLARQGKHALAAETIEELVALKISGANHLYNAACAYARCSLATKEAALIEKYGKRAVELLQQAVQAGFKDLEHMKRDRELTPIRKRSDFQAWMKKLNSGTK